MNDALNTLMQDSRIWQGHKQVRNRQPAESTGYTALDNQLGGTGWPRGALTECLLDAPGIGELQLVLPLMRQLSLDGKSVFWLNPPHTPYAPAMAREGVDLDRLIMVHPQSQPDLLWTLENCLRSPVTGLVLAWPGKLASRDIRRLQLAAEAGSNICILFRDRALTEHSSPAALRLELTAGKHQDLKINILKRRGGWPGQRCTLPLCRTDTTPFSDTRVVHGPWTTGQA